MKTPPTIPGPLPAGVRALAPVFISYRTSDGSELAAALAWALRATGVPVWHDITDLPPGDTTRRLREALASGLSGAVLLVTPDIQHSTVVRETELPALLNLEPDPAFTFAIGSIVASTTASAASPGLDYTAPDRLLSQPKDTLQRFKQYPLTTAGEIALLAREVASQRMQALRPSGRTTLDLDLQTRLDPRGTPSELPLAVRTRPPQPGQRIPDPSIWPQIATFLTDLPRLIALAGAQRLHIRGGAHLSVAFALGAAVPDTSPWQVTVEDHTGGIWGEPGPVPAPPTTLLDRSEPDLAAPTGAPIAVYVDLVPVEPLGDTFAAHLATHPGAFHTAVRLYPRRRHQIPAEAGSILVANLAAKIRAHAAAAATRHVHLFLRTPFPIAVLLGRALNTLEITLYEWDDAAPVARYIPVASTASGRGGGPLIL
ncbi:hypothetical protein ABH920_002758 [Catenulispora sp. EB89]|uniref:SAVED domain-containing protein n=1 Tax=Catenulispora sp. EB89 TaxID=3156257 RepID=UPI003515DECC